VVVDSVRSSPKSGSYSGEQTSGDSTTSAAPSLWRTRELELEHERMRLEERRPVRRPQVKNRYTYKNTGKIESVEGTQMLDSNRSSPALSLLTQATEMVENESSTGNESSVEESRELL